MMQLLFMATCFALVIRKVYLITASVRCTYICGCFYGLLSFHAYYSITIWKDITHGIITVLLLLALIEYFRSDKEKTLLVGALFILGMAFCLFRSNGYYAMALWLLPLGIYAGKEKRYTLLIVMLLAFSLSTIIKGPLYAACGIANTSYAEKLSIPAQQIAYVVKNKRSLTEEQEYYLKQIIDLKEVPKWYRATVSDNIKGHCQNKEFFEAHSLTYLKIWLQLGLNYPKDYVIAWVNQTRGYWYPNVRYWVYGSSVHENDLKIKRTTILLGDFFENKKMENWPLIGSFFNVAIYTWVLLALFCYSLAKRAWQSSLCYSLLLGVFISLMLATPVFAEFRYYYSVIASLPILLLLPMALRATNINSQ
jgi:hypothetical protein